MQSDTLKRFSSRLHRQWRHYCLFKIPVCRGWTSHPSVGSGASLMQGVGFVTRLQPSVDRTAIVGKEGDLSFTLWLLALCGFVKLVPDCKRLVTRETSLSYTILYLGLSNLPTFLLNNQSLFIRKPLAWLRVSSFCLSFPRKRLLTSCPGGLVFSRLMASKTCDREASGHVNLQALPSFLLVSLKQVEKHDPWTGRWTMVHLYELHPALQTQANCLLRKSCLYLAPPPQPSVLCLLRSCGWTT